SELLQKYKLPHAPRVSESDPEEETEQLSAPFHLPKSLVLREYQKNAIRAWINNNGRGVFAMATGTGKTLTALALAHAVYQKNKPLVIVIVCPYVNLCTQWIRELESFGGRAISCYESKSKWTDRLQEGYQKIRTGVRDMLFLVASNATFCTNAFQQS